jgi:hypothetical protein
MVRTVQVDASVQLTTLCKPALIVVSVAVAAIAVAVAASKWAA